MHHRTGGRQQGRIHLQVRCSIPPCPYTSSDLFW
jgi:hypothetical protein